MTGTWLLLQHLILTNLLIITKHYNTPNKDAGALEAEIWSINFESEAELQSFPTVVSDLKSHHYLGSSWESFW